MNHQIQHDGDVYAARVEHRQSVGFDEVRRQLLVTEGKQRRVKALYVTDLHCFAGLVFQVNEFPGLVQRLRQRFFHEYVAAALQRLFDQRVVGGRGGDDVHHVHSGNQLSYGREAAQVILFFYGGGRRVVRVVKPNQVVMLLCQADALQVDFSEVAYA